ncbi:MAG TPA: homocysteine S-methyltransferase family protein, partial [Abditibacteriaceae bacterium]|nr:homocysteine S-methyltransferase family protein [Abditibacteriaceae bacterium]
MNTTDQLHQLLQERILIIDGAMGTMIQLHKFEEADFRGERFATHSHDLKNNYDVLCLTQPDIIETIHRQYLDAGADIIETNTFNANAISMGHYKLSHIARELNVAAARLARRAVDDAMQKNPTRPRFVAGAIGPMNKTLTLGRDVEDPGKRDVTYDEVMAGYYEQVQALMESGVDLLLCETTFDTLNLKAAQFAIEKYFDDSGQRVPVMASVTF